MFRKSSMSTAAQQNCLIGLCMTIIAMCIAATLWAALRLRESRALAALLVLLVLLSMAEGVLACALYRNINKKHNDMERQDPSMPIRPPTSPVLALDSRTCALRNFSLPRERCLDDSPTIISRPLPIPPPYIATGICSNTCEKPRPLPALPNKVYDPRRHLSCPEIINDVIIQPLRIQKNNSIRQSLPLENTAQAETPADSVTGVAGSKTKLLSNASNFEFDVPDASSSQDTIIYFPSLTTDETEPTVSASSTTCPFIQDVQTEITDHIDELLVEQSVIQPTAPITPQHLAAPAIHIQAPTPTTTNAPVTPDAYQYGKHVSTPTIRLVNSFLEVPEKRSFSSLDRKWKGQPGFLGL